MPPSNVQPRMNGAFYRRNGASNEPIDQMGGSAAIAARTVTSVNVASQSATFSDGPFEAASPPTKRLAGAVAMKQDAYRKFRRICDELCHEAALLDDYLVDGVVVDEGLATVAEIEHHLERLYDSEWGEGECLKRIVVALQAQLGNTKWTHAHVKLLNAAAPFLRVRWLINEATVSECYEIIAELGLDQFRGTMSGDGIVRRYVLQEVKNE